MQREQYNEWDEEKQSVSWKPTTTVAGIQLVNSVIAMRVFFRFAKFVSAYLAYKDIHTITLHVAIEGSAT